MEVDIVNHPKKLEEYAHVFINANQILFFIISTQSIAILFSRQVKFFLF